MDNDYISGEFSRERSVKPLSTKHAGGDEGFNSPAPHHLLLRAL